jgi:hypothetical protein
MRIGLCCGSEGVCLTLDISGISETPDNPPRVARTNGSERLQRRTNGLESSGYSGGLEVGMYDDGRLLDHSSRILAETVCACKASRVTYTTLYLHHPHGVVKPEQRQEIEIYENRHPPIRKRL